MGIIFISHSSRNNTQALAVRDWLRTNGWRETFLDLDPAEGLAPGQRWQEELKKAGERCSAVVVLLSPEWVASEWCRVEFLVASHLGKRIFAAIVAPVPIAALPRELTAHYQITDLSNPATAGEDFERLRWGLKRAGLHPADFPWPPPGHPDRRPYRGLHSLEEQDAGVLFGRDAAITRGLDALRRMRGGAPDRLLVILGASGAGKSSFLKAGLLARLRRDEEHFLVLPTVRPARAPLSGREGLLAALGIPMVLDGDGMRRRLAELRGPVISRFERFAAAARESSPIVPPTIVLPIDQAEELFASDRDESAVVLDQIRTALAADDRFIVILTIRSDSYASLQSEARLADVPRLPFDLSPLSPGSFKQVIEGPGSLAQPPIVFEAALTDRLAADLNQVDALPLLAFTLERLTREYGVDGALELREYEEGLGGLEGAINKAVDAAFAAGANDPALAGGPRSIESLARDVFIPWLVTVDDLEAAPKRRVATMVELPGPTAALVQHFVNQRLLVSDTRGGEHTVEVSHEAILRHWKLLGRWIDEERANLLALAAVRRAASEWQRRLDEGTSSEELLVHRGERLARAASLLDRSDYRPLLEHGRAYLDACRRRDERDRATAEERLRRDREQLDRQRRLQRRVALALALVALVTTGFSYLAAVQSRAASRETSLLLTNYAQRSIAEGHAEQAARFAVLASRQGPLTVADASAAPTLARAAARTSVLFELAHGTGKVTWSESADGTRLLSWGADRMVRVWDAASGREIAHQIHAGAVAGTRFAPDGLRVLSWSNGDRIVRVWDAASGREIAHQTHEGGVIGGLFASDGARILSWGYGGTAMVWDAKSGIAMARQTHGEFVNAAAFSPDGTRVLSRGDDRTARVWNAASGALLASYTHAGGVNDAVFAPDGARVLSWGYDGGVAVWDAVSGRPFARQDHGGGVEAMFSMDGARVLSWGRDGVARIWDATSGREIARQLHRQPVSGAAFAAAGARALSWSRDGTVVVWDASSGGEIARHTHGDAVTGALFAADGARVLSWSNDHTARVWDAASGAEMSRQTHANIVYGASFAADGVRVLSWDSDGGSARVWDSRSGVELANQAHAGGAGGAMFTADSNRIVSWDSFDGVARIWEARSRTDIAHHKHGGPVAGATFTRDGTRVLSWSADKTARVWDAASGIDIAHHSHGEAVNGAALSADDTRVLSWSDDKTARVWSVTSGVEIARHVHDAAVRRAVFSPDGTRVLSWGDEPDKTASLWDAASGREIARLTHDGPVRGAVFAADGTHALSWSNLDRIVKVWDAQSGVEIARQRHERGPNGARFSPDGAQVLSWGHEGTVLVWEAKSGTEIARQTHEAPVQRAVFSTDGRRVLSSGDGATVRVWDARSGAELARQVHSAGSVGTTFAGDDRRVLSWGIFDGEVRVWDAATGAGIARHHHPSGVLGAVLSRDGARVLSWGQTDPIVRLWDARSGAEIARHAHQAHVAGAMFLKGDALILSWDSSAVAQVWDGASGIELARQIHSSGFRGPELAADGTRMLSWSADGMARVWSIAWALPRASNRALIAEVCARAIAHDSIRVITAEDTVVAPLLRDRIEENVCRGE